MIAPLTFRGAARMAAVLFAVGQFSAFASTNNYAAYRPVTVSSTYQTFYATNAVDTEVSDNSRWLGAAAGAGNWIAINLGAAVTLRQAHVYSGYQTNSSSWITNLQLQAWSGSAWTNIPGAVATNNSFATILNFTAPVTTTQIRLFTADPVICRLREITLWDEPQPLYTGVFGSQVPVSAVAGTPIVILPLGDSITLGASVPSWIPGGYRDPLHTLLTNAGYQIQFVGSDTNNPTTALTAAGNKAHEGHGSYTTSNLLANLDGVAAGPSANNGGFWLTGISGTRAPVYPDVILLMAGVNDLGVNQLLPAQGLAGVEALLNKLAALRPSALIVVSTLTPYIGAVYPLREQHEAEFNAALPALVAAQQAAGHRVVWCDVRSRINLTNAAAMLCSDGVHPNQAGYNQIAQMWFEAFQQLPLVENWRKIFFGSTSAVGRAADAADWDGDGQVNLLEFVLGTNPTNAVAEHPFQMGFIRDAGADYFSLSFPRRKNCGLSCVVEATETLSGLNPWTDQAIQIAPTVDRDAAFEQVTFRDTVPRNAAPTRFMRLRVVKP
jgi:lysophospholipase L1-like esterase